MKPRARGTRKILGVFGSLLAAAAAAMAAQAPNAQMIIQRASQVSEADWEAAPNYTCEETDKTSDGTKTYENLMIAGSPYQRLIAVNGRPLSGDEKKKQDRDLQRTTDERRSESPEQRQKRIAQYERERKRDHLMMQELSKAFNFQLTGQAKLNGHSVYVIKATPKAGYNPPNDETKALTGMQGTLWIDTQTDQWVKVEAQAVRPVSIIGFLARVEPGTMFELEKVPVSNGVWLPSRYSMKARAKIVGLITKHESDDETYSNYRIQNTDKRAGTNQGQKKSELKQQPSEFR